MRCAKHPNVETMIRCGKCETPVCVKCSVMGPAGIRCKDCASMRSSPLYKVSPGQLVVGVLGSLAVATAIGYGLAAVSGMGLFILWGAIIGGGLIGEVMLRLTGRKRGTQMEVVTGVVAAAGIIAGFLIWYSTGSGEVFLLYGGLLPYLQHNWVYIASAGIAVICAATRIKFF
jgi:hypothetical protein